MIEIQLQTITTTFSLRTSSLASTLNFLHIQGPNLKDWNVLGFLTFLTNAKNIRHFGSFSYYIHHNNNVAKFHKWGHKLYEFFEERGEREKNNSSMVWEMKFIS